jgi:hypothetical protein
MPSCTGIESYSFKCLNFKALFREKRRIYEAFEEIYKVCIKLNLIADNFTGCRR